MVCYKPSAAMWVDVPCYKIKKIRIRCTKKTRGVDWDWSRLWHKGEPVVAVRLGRWTCSGDESSQVCISGLSCQCSSNLDRSSSLSSAFYSFHAKTKTNAVGLPSGYDHCTNLHFDHPLSERGSQSCQGRAPSHSNVAARPRDENRGRQTRPHHIQRATSMHCPGGTTLGGLGRRRRHDRHRHTTGSSVLPSPLTRKLDSF